MTGTSCPRPARVGSYEWGKVGGAGVTKIDSLWQMLLPGDVSPTARLPRSIVMNIDGRSKTLTLPAPRVGKYGRID